MDLTGSWEGTWTSSTGGSGTFSSELLQARPTQGGGPPVSLSGTASFEGSTCSVLLSVVATFNPGGFVIGSRVYGTFTDDSVTIDFFAGVTSDGEGLSLSSGTYEVLEGGTCTVETGTFEASLSIPLHGPVVLGESVTVYDDLGNSTTFMFIQGLDPQTGRSCWTQRRVLTLEAPQRSSAAQLPDASPTRQWWALQDSNLGPSDYESLALTD